MSDLVLHVAAAGDAEVVALGHRAGVGEAEGEGLVEADVLGGLVAAELEADLVALVLATPGGHHHVGVALGVVGGDHQRRLRRDIQFGAHVDALVHILEFHSGDVVFSLFFVGNSC